MSFAMPFGNRGPKSLRSILWDPLRKSPQVLISPGGDLPHTSGLELRQFLLEASRECPHVRCAYDGNLKDLRGDDAVVIFGRLDDITNAQYDIVGHAGFPTDFEPVTRLARGLLLRTSVDSTAYPEFKDVGFVFKGWTSDGYARPLFWLSGTTDTGLVLAARWMCDPPSREMDFPDPLPDDPFEAVITGRPTTSQGSKRVEFNGVSIDLRWGGFVFNPKDGWSSGPKRPVVTVRSIGTDIISIRIGDNEFTESNGTKFVILRALVLATLKGDWISLQQILDGSKSDPCSQSNLDGMKARFYEIRKIDPRLILCEGAKLRLNADFHHVKV